MEARIVVVALVYIATKIALANMTPDKARELMKTQVLGQNHPVEKFKLSRRVRDGFLHQADEDAALGIQAFHAFRQRHGFGQIV
jgi:hypothetical protein